MSQFYSMYNLSMKGRKTAFTALNAHSSRSHAVFTLWIEQRIAVAANKVRVIRGKLSVADLAGHSCRCGSGCRCLQLINCMTQRSKIKNAKN